MNQYLGGAFNSLKLDVSASNPVSDLKNFRNERFETLLEHLKKTMIPIFHLDFDNIYYISDGSFHELVINSIKLASAKNGILNDFLMLKVRFQNSRFNYSAAARPFRGLMAKQLYFNNITNALIMESIFSESIVSEMLIENSPDLVSFVRAGDNELSNVLLHKLSIVNR